MNSGGINKHIKYYRICTMSTRNVCSYGPHCRMSEGFSLATEKCGTPSCARQLHHLCKGEFESRFQDVLGSIDSMSKRCIPCLLLENGSFTKEVCKEIGCTMKGATVYSDKSSNITNGAPWITTVTARTKIRAIAPLVKPQTISWSCSLALKGRSAYNRLGLYTP